MAQACYGKTISLPIEARGLRVLLVEQDVNYMIHMKKVLEQHSWRVTPSGRGKAALGHLYATNSEYDLIIYEIEMPGMHGFSFLEAMPKRIPVIMTSWRGDESLAAQATNYGASCFLLKPIMDQYLVDVAHSICFSKVLMTRRVNLSNYEYQSSTGPWDAPHSTAWALAQDIPTQPVSGGFQFGGFSPIEWVESTNRMTMGSSPQIIHGMGSYSNEPILEQNPGQMQGNSCWNMVGSGNSSCMQDVEFSPAMSNYSSSLLGNYNREEQVNTDKLFEFNYENNNMDTCLYGNEEVPKESSQMIGENEIDDETQELLSYYGYLSDEGNCQSGLVTQVEASDPHTVEQGEGIGDIFRTENETFQSFIDDQFVVAMEAYMKSYADNKDMVQVLREIGWFDWVGSKKKY